MARSSANEACLLILPDDTILAFIRQEGSSSEPLWRTQSTDGGATWGAAAQCATAYPGRPSAALFADTDVIVMCYRQAGTEKPVWGYSTDNGLTIIEHTPVFTNAVGVYGALWNLADGTIGMLQAAESGSTARIYYQQLVSGV